MEKRRWLEELRTLLAAQELPSAYIERMVLEMSDHLDEVMEEKSGMKIEEVTDRAGNPVDLAQTVAEEYRKRLFCRRHSILTFVVLPVPALILLWVSFLVVQCGLGLLLRPFAAELADNTSPAALVLIIAIELVGFGLMMVPFCLPAAVLCRLARRSGQDWRWPMLSCAILCLWVGLRGSNPVGFGPVGSLGLARCMVMALPLTIGAWCSWRRSHRNSPAVA